MLILMRRPHEEVIIRTPSGEVIVVAVTQLSNRCAHLGFSAPLAYSINRAEIDVRKQQERHDAA